MLSLYPDIKPYATHRLAVDPPHDLYIEETGNPMGVPVLFVHGGPGAGCTERSRCFFDPEVYRIVVFDQRGAGRSTPHADLSNNTTQALVADIEAIRQLLGIDRWVVFGGSWGSTLSLVYAQTHPTRVLGLILRGIFLCRDEEIDWFYQRGANWVFPDYWEDYAAVIPPAERGHMLQAFYKRLTSSNDIERLTAAKAWSVWEGRTATLRPDQKTVDFFGDTHVAMSLARIEAHFFVNHAFMTPNQILNDAHTLQGIPGIIVHGRYDLICPLENAWLLHKAGPDSQLNIIRDAGHAAYEAGIADALIHATREFGARFAKQR